MAVNIVGWAHRPLGRPDGQDLESWISGVSRAAPAHAGTGGAGTSHILGNASCVEEEASPGLSFPGIFAQMRKDLGFEFRNTEAMGPAPSWPTCPTWEARR